MKKLTILFLCTGNACRSQMAEGWARHLKSSLFDAYSAGIAPHGLDPRAVRAMQEVGVDISTHTSKHVSSLMHMQFDYVITVCGQAHETCPRFPEKTNIIHVGFEDPPYLARNAQSDEDAMVHYRRIRDEIRAFIETLPDALTTT